MLAPPVAKTKPKTTSAAESNRVLKAPRPSPGPGLSNQAMLRLVGSKSDHARHAGSGHSGPSAVPPLVHDVLRSPGRPLDPATRAVMEPRFGQDFGQVRLHTDERAAESARAVNASAYAAGRHLVFGAGRYSPTTAPGRRLLAHELAHSIQQGFAPDPRPRLVDDQHGALESEAAESAESVIEGASPRGPGSKIPIAPTGPATSLQRQVDIKIPFSSSSREETTTRSSSGAQETDAPALRLNDYNDRNPLHDPSKLSDAHIKSTNEFKSYMASELRWQWQYHMTSQEALLACRLILRRLREGSHVDFKMEAADFMLRARRQLGTLQETEKLVGKLEHVSTGSADPDDPHPDFREPETSRSAFLRWILADGPEPTNASTMNCWEMVLFGAFRGGFMTKAKIKNIYETARKKYRLQSMDPVAVLENELCQGYYSILSLSVAPMAPEPLPGDIVSLDQFKTHVAISLGTKTPAGGHQVISLHGGKVERVTIEDLVRWFRNSGYSVEAVNLCHDPWRGK